jgi:glycosyltransferase involved in cell wall biosynthesis
MRLGFHYHIPAYIKNEQIYTLSLQGLFIDSLAEHFDSITLFLYKPTRNQIDTLDYAIQSNRVKLVSLVAHYSIPVRLLLYLPFMRKKFVEGAKNIDVMLIRAPTPLLPLITETIKTIIPYSYLVVGEMLEHIDNLQQTNWRKSLIKQYVLWNENKQQKFAKEGLVFCNSTVVFNKYKQFSKVCVPIKTTTLKKSDFFVRRDVTNSSPYQILFTGRIESGKGILEVINAIGLLKLEGIHCILNIVGWIESGDQIAEIMKKRIEELDLKAQIIFHGKKNVGEDLLGFYRRADFFILASQVNEGFPRTVWEALASSTPVIVTEVGSVPYYLKHEHDALFIEKRNPLHIKDTIIRLINDDELRRRLIRNGLETVSEVTFEVQSKKMYDSIVAFVNNFKL